MLRDVDPVAVAERLDRMRGAQIAREYTDWAGLDRGYRTFWSGRPGVWYRGRIIDIGRRPDTGRAPRRGEATHAATMQARQQPPKKTTPRDAEMLSYFVGRGNEPATMKEIAAALKLGLTQTHRLLQVSQAVHVVHSGVGQMPDLYAPVDVLVEINVIDTMPARSRAIYDLLAQHGEMQAAEIAKQLDISAATVSRAPNKWPQVFETEKRSAIVNGTKIRQVWLRLRNHNETEGTK